ncbi:hypothetical protein F441_21040, partial [Phytophthora nicotianae CJ01A1]
MVNASIFYREVLKRRETAPAGHAEFREVLQTQLHQTTNDDFEE